MLPPTSQDCYWMRQAINLAKKAHGKTAPNPTVGALIVFDGQMIGSGYHHQAGSAHAEIEALRSLSSRDAAKGATLYVTLEPCSTHGKTPPCTEAIIASGITRVCYGATDPNPQHQGRADAILITAGVEVTPGLMATECEALNTHWNYRMRYQRPWVIAKFAMSLDGMICSPPAKRWISSSESRTHAMKERAKVEAILIGSNTLRNDNPALTIRLPRETSPSQKELLAKQPWRVVWSPSGSLSREEQNHYQLFHDSFAEKTILLEKISLKECLSQLASRGISSLMIEGGGFTLGEAARLNLINELHSYLAPQFQGGPVAAFAADPTTAPLQLRELQVERSGPDLFMKALVCQKASLIG